MKSENKNPKKKTIDKNVELAIQKVNESRVPATKDPLKYYLAEINKYPVLTEKEERALVKKVHEDADIDAARTLVNSHLRLVVKIAMQYRSAYHNVLDLIQEGNVGLLHALKNYNPEKGARLAHYATWWIKSYVLKFILDNFRLIRIGTTKEQKKLFYNLMKEKEKMEQQGFKADSKSLAEKFDTTEEEIDEMTKRLTQPELALEAPVSSEHEVLLKDFLPIDEELIEEQLGQAEARNILTTKLDEFSEQLNERELKIFRERLLAELPRTLQEIANEYGITKERVRQIESNILDRIRGFFKEKGVDVDLSPGA